MVVADFVAAARAKDWTTAERAAVRMSDAEMRQLHPLYRPAARNLHFRGLEREYRGYVQDGGGI